MTRRTDQRRASSTTDPRVPAATLDDTRGLDRTPRAAGPGADAVVMPLLGEEIVVTKPVVETGRVSVRRVTHVESQPIAEALARESIEISREPIMREVETLPPIREEGDTLVIPVVEERLVIQRRLILTEEVRVRRRRTCTVHRENVPLRHHEVVITRGPVDVPGEAPRSGVDESTCSNVRVTFVPSRRETMRYETIAAAYDSRAHAQAAIDALKMAGFHGADISILDKQLATNDAIWTGKGVGLWQRIFGRDVRQHEAAVYNQAVEGGGAVVSVRVPESEVAHATGILDLHHPIDVRDRALTTGVVPAERVEATVASSAASPPPVRQVIAVTPKFAEAHEQVLRLAEEQLQVGKRMLETGKTRVRRYVTERDVSADVTLHEEHAEVVRRAVTDPKYLGTVDWADKEIEVVETAEQALVNKTAKVVEEIGLNKVGSDHVQTLHEKVRRQQVEVERLGPDGKRLATDLPKVAERPVASLR